MKAWRNTKKVIEDSFENAISARAKSLMHNQMIKRRGKKVLLENGKWVTEYLNCSYLGLDVEKEIIEAYKMGVDELGIGFCAARTRLSTRPNMQLEAALSDLWRGKAVVFPSVTSTHQSVMPLISSGSFWGQGRPVRFIFDKFAHSSMQSLIPILDEEAEVYIIDHNDLDSLRFHIENAKTFGELPIYVSDGIYSMGGHCPIKEVESLLETTDLHWYVDDAHGTSLYGDRGEGYVLEKISPKNCSKIALTFSLAKGFGATGGGVLVFSEKQEQLIRTFGQNYMFSAPMDYGAISAAIKIVDYHLSGEIIRRRNLLRENEYYFDQLLSHLDLNDGPIKMIHVGDSERTMILGESLMNKGILVSTVFFPVVPRHKGQLRICLSALHTKEDISYLAESLLSGLKEIGA